MSYSKLPSWKNKTVDFTNHVHGFLNDYEIPYQTYNTLFSTLIERINYLSTSLRASDTAIMAVPLARYNGERLFSESINYIAPNETEYDKSVHTSKVTLVEAYRENNSPVGMFRVGNLKPIVDKVGNPIVLDFKETSSGGVITVPSNKTVIRPEHSHSIVGVSFRYYVDVPKSLSMSIWDIPLKSAVTIKYPKASRLMNGSIQDMSDAMNIPVVKSRATMFDTTEHNNPNEGLGEPYVVSQTSKWYFSSTSSGPNEVTNPIGIHPNSSKWSYFQEVFIPLPVNEIPIGDSTPYDLIINDITLFFGDVGVVSLGASNNTTMKYQAYLGMPKSNISNIGSTPHGVVGFGLYSVGANTSNSSLGSESLLLSLASISESNGYRALWQFYEDLGESSMAMTNAYPKDSKVYKVMTTANVSDIFKTLTSTSSFDVSTESLETYSSLSGSYLLKSVSDNQYQEKGLPYILLKSDNSSDTLLSTLVPVIPTPKGSNPEMFYLMGTSRLLNNILTNEGLWNPINHATDQVMTGTVVESSSWGDGSYNKANPPLTFGVPATTLPTLDNEYPSALFSGYTSRDSSGNITIVLTITSLPPQGGYDTKGDNPLGNVSSYPKTTVVLVHNGQEVLSIKSSTTSTNSGSYEYLSASLIGESVMYVEDIPNSEHLVLWEGSISSPLDSASWSPKVRPKGMTYYPHVDGINVTDYTYLSLCCYIKSNKYPYLTKSNQTSETYGFMTDVKVPMPFSDSMSSQYITITRELEDNLSAGRYPRPSYALFSTIEFFKTVDSSSKVVSLNARVVKTTLYEKTSKKYIDVSGSDFHVKSIKATNHNGWTQSDAQSCVIYNTPTVNKY